VGGKLRARGEAVTTDAETTAVGPDEPVPDQVPVPRGISRNALVLIAVVLGLGAALALAPDPPGVLVFLFVVAGWLLSVAVHEFGHALVAYHAGDTTVAARGYLTLDPLKYTDLGVTLVIPVVALMLGGIGFPGGAVYLRDDLMRSRRGRSLASLAGPAGTLLVLLALGIIAAAVSAAGVHGPLILALAFLAFLQATALVLNLLPIPGLDGFGVLRPFLPPAVDKALRPLGAVAFLALFALIFFVPGASALLFGPAILLTQAAGFPPEMVGAGWEAFEFWK
jgi:Zn-dependent protease